jgi:predicted small secreted protein
MIKKSMKTMAIIFASSILLSSCYSYTSVVGKGAQGNQQTT